MISKREAQLLAVEDCDYEMPSEWIREDIKIMSCEFDGTSQEWNVYVWMKFGHGDIAIFDGWISADGEVSLSWAAV